MTVFEFLKSVCLAMGYELTVDPVDGVTIGFGKYGDPKGDDFKALERVLSVDRVARSAWGDNTAAAVVGFDSDDYVTDTIEVEYGIPNEVNTERKEWRSKFSEGNVGDNGVPPIASNLPLKNNVIQVNLGYKFQIKKKQTSTMQINL